MMLNYSFYIVPKYHRIFRRDQMLAPQDCRGGGADRYAAGFSKLGHRHVAHDLNAAFAALRHQRLRQRGVGVLRQKHKFRRLIRQRAAKLFDPDHLFSVFSSSSIAAPPTNRAGRPTQA